MFSLKVFLSKFLLPLRMWRRVSLKRAKISNFCGVAENFSPRSGFFHMERKNERKNHFRLGSSLDVVLRKCWAYSLNLCLSVLVLIDIKALMSRDDLI